MVHTRHGAGCVKAYEPWLSVCASAPHTHTYTHTHTHTHTPTCLCSSRPLRSVCSQASPSLQAIQFQTAVNYLHHTHTHTDYYHTNKHTQIIITHTHTQSLPPT